MKPHLGIILSSFLLIITSVQSKENPICNDTNEQCIETGKLNLSVSVGLGLRTNPLFQSDNIPLIVLPEISYYADNFFIENLDIGYTLYDSAISSLNLIATPSYDSVFFNRWDPGNLLIDIASVTTEVNIGFDSEIDTDPIQINPNELSSRKFSYLAGLEYSYQFRNSLLQISLLADITNIHSGKEARFAYAYSFNQSVSTTLGFTWKDQNLTNYYYGVDPNEVADVRAVYHANSSINPFIRISFRPHSNQETGSWRFSFELQKLDKQISNSPVVKDDYIITFYAGKTFKFE